MPVRFVLKLLGCGGGLVVWVLAFYSGHVSSNPTGHWIFCPLLWKDENKWKRGRGWPIKKCFKVAQKSRVHYFLFHSSKLKWTKSFFQQSLVGGNHGYGFGFSVGLPASQKFPQSCPASKLHLCADSIFFCVEISKNSNALTHNLKQAFIVNFSNCILGNN